MTATLTWTPAGGSNSASQDVQYRVRGAGSWTTFQTVSASTATLPITGLTDNVIYEFRVVNNCTVGGPTPSNEDEDIKFTCPVLTVTDTYNSVSVSFTHLGGAVNAYDIQLLNTAGNTVLSTFAVSSPSGTVSHTFTGLTASTSYNVRVIPKATGDTAYSKTDCALSAVTTDGTPTCDAPTSVSASLS
jgi:hypothetical protein